jgi:hypothetical protein
MEADWVAKRSMLRLCWLLALSVLKIRKETANKNLSRHLLHVETTRIWNG